MTNTTLPLKIVGRKIAVESTTGATNGAGPNIEMMDASRTNTPSPNRESNCRWFSKISFIRLHPVPVILSSSVRALAGCPTGKCATWKHSNCFKNQYVSHLRRHLPRSHKLRPLDMAAILPYAEEHCRCIRERSLPNTSAYVLTWFTKFNLTLHFQLRSVVQVQGNFHRELFFIFSLGRSWYAYESSRRRKALICGDRQPLLKFCLSLGNRALADFSRKFATLCF